MVYCEITNAGRYDFIIQFGWWQDMHTLKNIADLQKWVIDEAKCHAHIEDEAVADLIEWDETVAHNEEALYVGRIGQEDEGEIWLETLPKPSWQYKELFEEQKGEMLAPRRTFDHAINLKQVAEPPMGPNLPMVGTPVERTGQIH